MRTSKIDRQAWSGSRAAGHLAVWLAAAAAIAAVLAPAASAAEASRIVYACVPNLCVADPESGASTPITTDGATDAYQYPSVSHDGTLVAAVRGDAVAVGGFGTNLTQPVATSRDINDAAIAPDGSGVGESHSYVDNVFQCSPYIGCGLQLVDRSATSYTRLGAPPDDNTRVHDGGGGVGFAANGGLLSSYYDYPTDTNRICVIADPFAEDPPCVDRVTDAATLSSPTGSPDGTLLAIAVGTAGSDATSVNLYAAASGAPVRKLADNAGSPTFSPDGKQVAYGAADGWIYVVPTSGGNPRRLVQGSSPSWGAGAAPVPGGRSSGPPLLASKSLRYRAGKVKVKLACEGVDACRGKLTLKRKRVRLGKAKYRIAAGQSRKVKVRIKRKGKRVLSRSPKQKVKVELRTAGGERLVEKVTLKAPRGG
ncbi:MAG: hypothetical protein GEU88_00385 [Solirubrobacterales bacterium]|nr:hypothetical protein [Solirubrobacterales bacterium]